MLRSLSKSISLLLFLVVICCGIYPLALWAIGQTFFPFQANGSMLFTLDNKIVGSQLIAQPFTRGEYFQPRPSAASYDASASASSSLAASNYALRNRVTRTLGLCVKYGSGLNVGKPVGPDVEKWFQNDQFQGKTNIVAQWAILFPTIAQAWVSSDQNHSKYVDEWVKSHPALVVLFKKENATASEPKAVDLAVEFFKSFSQENPGKFPIAVNHTTFDHKTQTTMELVNVGPEIQSTFFDMWRQDHSTANLWEVPGDMVMTSASGLDPHITLKNAEFQLDRVASSWATKMKADPAVVREKIQKILKNNASAPFGGIAGENIVNVLEVNLALHKQFLNVGNM
jgi:K+-transporting ATPase ATPase C chain